MKFKLTIVFFIYINLFSFSQCFDCAKNFGGHTGDVVRDLKKAVDGIYLLTNSQYSSIVYKFDFNCNLIWKKEINDEYKIVIDKIVSDNLGNTYLLVSYSIGRNSLPGPFDFDGFIVYPGLNLYKLDIGGNIVWNRHVGHNVSYNITNIYMYNNELYIIGSFGGNININGEIPFVFSGVKPRAFIAKYNINGGLIDAQAFGDGIDNYTSTEMDHLGNIYLSRYDKSNYLHSDIDKINSDLIVVWSKEISNATMVSNQSIYTPTKLYYSRINDKLYLWGAYRGTVNVLGNTITSTIIGGFQSLLTEYNPLNGDLERIKKVDNSSLLGLPGVSGSLTGNTAYITEKDNSIYVLSSFRGNLSFSNTNVTSIANRYDFSEELVLFKIDLTNFNADFILKSFGTPNLNYHTVDSAGPILFHNEDLFLTSNFSSKPLTINGTLIDNNSGNNSYDVMLYKYGLNGTISSDQIDVRNTCLSNTTNFNLIGDFDTISWDFGDSASGINNVSSELNPSHVFANSGVYSVTATVTCGSDSQELEKEVIITVSPVANEISPIYECEVNQGEGVSHAFDTATIEAQVLMSQTNMLVSYFNQNGNPLPSPLPNPMSNSIQKTETINVRVANQNNPECYAETSFNLIVNPLPEINTIDNIYSCDNDYDGIAVFDFNHLEVNLLGTQTGMIVEYFYENGQQLPNPLPNTIYNIIINQETITARITNPSTDCFNETTFDLIVNPLPTANALKEIIGCDDNNDGISEYFDTSNVESTVLGGQTGMEVSYYDSMGNFLSNTLTNPYINIIPNEEIIIVRVTSTKTSCYAETPLVLTTSVKPLINKPLDIYACNEGNGISTFDLSSIENEITGNQTGLNVYYFDSTGNELTNQINSSFQNIESWSQTIQVKVEVGSNNLCFSETSFNLIIDELPQVDIQDSYFLCDLKPSLSISINDNYDTWEWKFEDGSVVSNSNEVVLVNAGDYELKITEIANGKACENTFNFELIRSVLPEIINVEYQELSENNFIRIVVSGDGEFEYSIDDINFQNSNYFNGIQGGVYNVSVRDIYGCGKDTQKITIVGFPRYFTPNGDGANDNWQIKGIESYANPKIYIYNRYGKLLKQLSSRSTGWDGTFNGEMLPSDDYWFKVLLDDGREFMNHFTLKR